MCKSYFKFDLINLSTSSKVLSKVNFVIYDCFKRRIASTSIN